MRLVGRSRKQARDAERGAQERGGGARLATANEAKGQKQQARSLELATHSTRPHCSPCRAPPVASAARKRCSGSFSVTEHAQRTEIIWNEGTGIICGMSLFVALCVLWLRSSASTKPAPSSRHTDRGCIARSARSSLDTLCTHSAHCAPQPPPPPLYCSSVVATAARTAPPTRPTTCLRPRPTPPRPPPLRPLSPLWPLLLVLLPPLLLQRK